MDIYLHLFVWIPAWASQLTKLPAKQVNVLVLDKLKGLFSSSHVKQTQTTVSQSFLH